MKSILHLWNSRRQSASLNLTPPLAYGLLCWLTVWLLEIEGCRGKELLQTWEVSSISLLLLLFPVNPIKGYWLPVDNRTAVFRFPS